MSSYMRWGVLIGIILIFLSFHPVAQAQTPFDVTECAAGPVTVVFQSQEMTVSGLEGYMQGAEVFYGAESGFLEFKFDSNN
jgi:hypothetical protein